MAPLRLLHFADVHLGVENYGRFDSATGLNSRLLDFTARLDQVIDHAIARRVDLVVFAGDAYRSRDPSPTQQREFARRVRRLSQAGIPTFLLVGNHDLPAASGRANSLDIYDTLAVPNVTVGRQPQIHRIETVSGPIQVIALPWLRRSALLMHAGAHSLTADEARAAIQERAATSVRLAVEQLDRSVPAILVGHLSVEGATYGSERSVLVGEDIVLPRSSLALDPIRYVALGHIHKHQALGETPPVVYPGSIERIDFGEEHDAKGFVIVEIDREETRWHFEPLPARRFVTVRVAPRTERPTEEVIAEIERAAPADAIVRLIVEAAPDIDARIEYGLVRRALKDAACIAGIRRDLTRTDRRVAPGAGIEALTPKEALDRYLRARDVPPERRALLLDRADVLIKEAPE